MSTLAMTVAYDGAPFCGFARQPGQLTVQGELERALGTLFAREVPTVCAGRTDAGVHALGQVVSFELEEGELEGRSLAKLQRSLNALTHDAISVRELRIAPDGFSARFDAKWREYRYRLVVGQEPPVFLAPYAWWLRCDTLDVDAMREAAACLIGEPDFKSFCLAVSAVDK
ncbi:MAG: tRNA pseudouridine synthase A [Coriobacteriales bacterium]|nr:tRNA pseudouridine synthase A [Coriobacteriales bacterium]